MAPPAEAEVLRVTRDVTARGVRMRVLEAGSERLPPVVLVHSFFASHLEFDDVIDSLARRFHVIAPDLPGFGESEKPTPSKYPYGVEAFAEATADLIAAYGVGRAFVVGHALGGAVALTLATHHAELVARLALVAPLCYPFPLGWLGRLPRMPVLGGLLFKQLYGYRAFRSHFLRRVFANDAIAPLERIDRHYELFNSPSARESAYAVLSGMLDTRPVVARIPRITQPTLVLWGRDDPILPAALALRLVREIPNARLELFDTAHSPHEARPQEFVFIVTEFFEGGR